MALPVSGTTVDVNETTPETASGPTIFTFSGTKGPTKNPRVAIHSRSGTAAYTTTYAQVGFGRFRLDLAPGDDYIYDIEVNGGTCDLAAADV